MLINELAPILILVSLVFIAIAHVQLTNTFIYYNYNNNNNNGPVSSYWKCNHCTDLWICFVFVFFFLLSCGWFILHVGSPKLSDFHSTNQVLIRGINVVKYIFQLSTFQVICTDNKYVNSIYMICCLIWMNIYICHTIFQDVCDFIFLYSFPRSLSPSILFHEVEGWLRILISHTPQNQNGFCPKERDFNYPQIYKVITSISIVPAIRFSKSVSWWNST